MGLIKNPSGNGKNLLDLQGKQLVTLIIEHFEQHDIRLDDFAVVGEH
jgi:hypothetical protein